VSLSTVKNIKTQRDNIRKQWEEREDAKIQTKEDKKDSREKEREGRKKQEDISIEIKVRGDTAQIKALLNVINRLIPPPARRYTANFHPGEEKKGKLVRFQEDNDCPEERRPITRKSRSVLKKVKTTNDYCDHLRFTYPFYGKTSNGYGCCYGATFKPVDVNECPQGECKEDEYCGPGCKCDSGGTCQKISQEFHHIGELVIKTIKKPLTDEQGNLLSPSQLTELFAPYLQASEDTRIEREANERLMGRGSEDECLIRCSRHANMNFADLTLPSPICPMMQDGEEPKFDACIPTDAIADQIELYDIKYEAQALFNKTLADAASVEAVTEWRLEPSVLDLLEEANTEYLGSPGSLPISSRGDASRDVFETTQSPVEFGLRYDDELVMGGPPMTPIQMAAPTGLPERENYKNREMYQNDLILNVLIAYFVERIVRTSLPESEINAIKKALGEKEANETWRTRLNMVILAMLLLDLPSTYSSWRSRSVFVGKPSDSAIDKAYETLNLQKGATQKDVVKAYRRLTLKYHPDKNRDLTKEELKETVRIFNEIVAARELLVNQFYKYPEDVAGFDPKPAEETVESLEITPARRQISALSFPGKNAEAILALNTQNLAAQAFDAGKISNQREEQEQIEELAKDALAGWKAITKKELDAKGRERLVQYWKNLFFPSKIFLGQAFEAGALQAANDAEEHIQRKEQREIAKEREKLINNWPANEIYLTLQETANANILDYLMEMDNIDDNEKMEIIKAIVVAANENNNVMIMQSLKNKLSLQKGKYLNYFFTLPPITGLAGVKSINILENPKNGQRIYVIGEEHNPETPEESVNQSGVVTLVRWLENLAKYSSTPFTGYFENALVDVTSYKGHTNVLRRDDFPVRPEQSLPEEEGYKTLFSTNPSTSYNLNALQRLMNRVLRNNPWVKGLMSFGQMRYVSVDSRFTISKYSRLNNPRESGFPARTFSAAPETESFEVWEMVKTVYTQDDFCKNPASWWEDNKNEEDVEILDYLANISNERKHKMTQFLDTVIYEDLGQSLFKYSPWFRDRLLSKDQKESIIEYLSRSKRFDRDMKPFGKTASFYDILEAILLSDAFTEWQSSFRGKGLDRLDVQGCTQVDNFKNMIERVLKEGGLHLRGGTAQWTTNFTDFFWRYENRAAFKDDWINKRGDFCVWLAEYKILDAYYFVKFFQDNPQTSIFFGGDAHAKNSVKFFKTQGYKILKGENNAISPIILGKEWMTDYFLGNPKFDEWWKKIVNQTKDKDFGVLEEYIGREYIDSKN